MLSHFLVIGQPGINLSDVYIDDQKALQQRQFILVKWSSLLSQISSRALQLPGQQPFASNREESWDLPLCAAKAYISTW